MRLLYDCSIWCLNAAFQLAALFHPKARAWAVGRRQWRTNYAASFRKKNRVLWVHVASLGEFEQGRPVIEAFREQRPDWQIVLSFFSPSGYQIRKQYPAADFVCYLPADTRRNARDFVDLIQPDAVLFIKYEFWANYLFELKKRNTPTLLVSALFRPDHYFFRWYGVFGRQMLGCFSHFFVQNQGSAALLSRIGFTNITIAGDSRVDRVLQLAQQVKKNAVVEGFLSAPHSTPPMVDHFSNLKIEKKNLTRGNSGLAPALIAGSTWPEDEKMLSPLIGQVEFEQLRWIIAPHEPSEKHFAQLLPKLPSSSYVFYSDRLSGKSNPTPEPKVLLIDGIGFLNSLYRYGWVAYIGGGFGKGIHNTLEPAAFGLPVIFGPNYHKFEEARQMVALGGAFPVHNPEEMAAVLRQLQNPEFYQKAVRAVSGYLQKSQGATELVLQYLSDRDF